MRVRSDSSRFFVFLAGGVVLTALAVADLPPPAELFRAPSTPFDHSAPSAAADYRLFQNAARVIPAGASLSPVAEPRNAVRETSLARLAVGLMPGRKVLPSAVWNAPTRLEEQADFLVVFGSRPFSPPGRLVLETPEGSVWRRRGG